VDVAPVDAHWQTRLDDFELDARKLTGVLGVGFSGYEGDFTVHLTLSDMGAALSARSDLPRLLGLYFDRPVSCALEVAGGPAGEFFHVDLDRPVEHDSGSSGPPQRASAPLVVDITSAPPMPAPAARPPRPAPILAPVADEPASELGAAVASRRVEMLDVRLTGEGAGVEVRLSYGIHQATGTATGAPPKAAAEATLAALRLLGWKAPFVVRSAIRLAVGVDRAIIVHVEGAGADRMAISRARTPQEAAVKATLQALNRYLADPRHRNDERLTAE
jgi:hypothetical protein